jgi:hypothetical protein
VTALLSVFLEKPMDFPNIEKATENDPFFLMDAASADAASLYHFARYHATHGATSLPVDL